MTALGLALLALGWVIGKVDDLYYTPPWAEIVAGACLLFGALLFGAGLFVFFWRQMP